MTGYDTYINKYEKKIDNIISTSKYNEFIKCVELYMKNSLSTRSIYNYISIIDRFLEISNKEPGKITLDDYNRYLAKQAKTVPSNQIVCYHALKYFSDYMYASGKANKNWMESVKRPKSKEVRKTIEKRETGFLNEAEIKELLFSVQHSAFYKEYNSPRRDALIKRDICVINIALMTGLRSAAICKIDIGDIDIENRILVVVDKGEKVQEYNLTSNTIESIEEWLSVRKVLCRGNNEALFVSGKGDRLSYDGLYKIVKDYGKTIGRDDLSPHKLRASYGTALYNKTKDIFFVSQAMGHSGTEVTKLYIRGKQKQIRKDAAKFMSSIIGG